MKRLREIAEAAGGRHDPCGMCDGSGPWEAPWAVVDDIKGDGHWDNEFHVLTEDGEGPGLATFQYRPHAEHFATFNPPTVLALLDVAEAAEVADGRWTEQTASGWRCRGCGSTHDFTSSMADRCPPCLIRSALARLRDAIPAPSFTDCPDCGQMTVEIIDGVAALTCPICEGVTA